MPDTDPEQIKLRQAALEYHELPKPGKIAIAATKQLVNQRDLALAYSPGVAAACEEIVADPANAFRYTARGNLVGVVTNGTAVLGLGNIGALAAKPVMEGKAVLFKKFAGIDVFDIELEQNDLDKLIDTIAALEPTFGGINLEDIKAPDCFYVERALRERMKIPVFHDDQHGTAIVVGAAVLNAMQVTGKDLKRVKLVASGAGAAALACLGLLVKLGLPREHIWVTDLAGVVYAGRTELMDDDKAVFAQPTELRTLAEVIAGADIFLGLSAGGVLKREMVATMAAQPVIFALANPTPEIAPEEVKLVRSDALIATGRTDYPNQVNNVLCFPYIFRGALDCGATTITAEMEIAAVHAIAALAQAEQNEVVAKAYLGETLAFGPQYLIPKPFDPRLMMQIAPAVAQAAADSGVASRPIADMDAYRAKLQTFVYASGTTMRPIFNLARQAARKRVAYAEGEEERVLRAVQTVVDEGLAHPTLIGRRDVIVEKTKNLGLRLDFHKQVRIVDPQQDHEILAPLTERYQRLVERRGVQPESAARWIVSRHGIAAAMLLEAGHVDAALCGGLGDWTRQLANILPIIPRQPTASRLYSLSALILPNGALFFCDTHLNLDPTAEQIAEMTLLAAKSVRRFGLAPKAALLSYSSFGSSDSPSARKMRAAMRILRDANCDFELDGEMHADAALSDVLRGRYVSSSPLTGSANLLVMPSLDAANIALTLLSAATEGLLVGPLLLGVDKPVHVMVPSVTARGIVNMTALAVAQAASRS